MTNYEELKVKIDEISNKYLAEMIEYADYVADHPEESGTELETSKLIVKILREHGYEVEYPFGGFEYAFRGIAGENNHSHKAAILVEYDALPGVGHACGHNVSGAISLLAGFATKEIQDELDCDIHVIGTPQEETDGAKCTFAEDGLFDNYDMAMMIHLHDENLVYCKLNGLASIMYNFHGKASHAGAAPWEGRNALNAATLMMHGLDCIRGCSKPDARINSVMFKGGYAGGSIPEEAQIETWVRSPENDHLELLLKRADNCAEGGALMAECTWDKYHTAKTYYPLKRNLTGEEVIRAVYGEVGEEVNGNHDRLFGSSDMGNVSLKCPAFHPTLQLSYNGEQIHSREFAALNKTDRAHDCISIGSKIIAYTIANIFSDEEKLAKMKAEFEGK